MIINSIALVVASGLSDLGMVVNVESGSKEGSVITKIRPMIDRMRMTRMNIYILGRPS
jgi:hypothetical protein